MGTSVTVVSALLSIIISLRNEINLEFSLTIISFLSIITLLGSDNWKRVSISHEIHGDIKMKRILYASGNVISDIFAIIEIGQFVDGNNEKTELNNIHKHAFITAILNAMNSKSGFGVVFMPDKYHEKEFYKFRTMNEGRGNQFVVIATVAIDPEKRMNSMTTLGINGFPSKNTGIYDDRGNPDMSIIEPALEYLIQESTITVEGIRWSILPNLLESKN